MRGRPLKTRRTDVMNCTRLAQALSWLLHPFVQPLYLIVLLLTCTVFAAFPLKMKLYLGGVVVLYTMLIPVLALGVLHRIGRLSDFRIDNRSERILPLLIGAACYVLCALTLGKIAVAAFLRKFMIAGACCELMCLFVSMRWKISLHLSGMGALTAMLVLLNFIGVGHMFVPMIVAVLASGALASARLYLGSHNGWQILAGYCGGFAVATLAMLFL